MAAALAMPVAASAGQTRPADNDGDDNAPQDIVVRATRSGRSADREPIRVEVTDQEDVEEKMMEAPGNISELVSETPGVRTQITSPSLGSANIRMQGMKGRYTQLLADGLPLYGGQVPSIGLLQIPPTDLGRVEVIKGAASALYGPSALGGVINLISRRPDDDPQADIVLNASSQDEQDATAYVSSPIAKGVGASITGGFSRQTRADLNGDGWADVPGYNRWTIRPRLFWSGPDGASVLVTAGAMKEQRAGGTLPGDVAPDGRPFAQRVNTRRFDGGLVADLPLATGMFHLRASGMTQTENQRFGATIEDDRHQTYFGEASFTAKTARTSWLVGAAFQADLFRSVQFAGFNYSYTTPALFGQVEHDVLDELTLAGSVRWDDHSRYGSRVSPRLSLLYRPGRWAIRASLGQGFFAPTPFVEELEETGLSRLKPIGRLKAETARTGSVDVSYKAGPLKANLTLFGSNINRAVRLEDDGPDHVELVNIQGLTRTRGIEAQLAYRLERFTITGSYVLVDATEPDPSGSGRRTVPLTPRNTGGLTLQWEDEGKGKIGLEAYYTSPQLLEDNPYRTRSRPYVEIGAMGELVLGRISLFINAENLLNVRQTRYDPLLLSQRAPSGAWTVDAWAPLEGRVINGGLRFRFGDKD